MTTPSLPISRTLRRATLGFLALGSTVLSGTVAADGHGDGGIVKLSSAHGPAATLDKLEKIVTGKGFTVFARIDHTAGAAKVGEELGPTQTLIFGNPKVGTKFMQSQQGAALDLPVRVAAWTDASGAHWVAYNDPAWMTHRHGIEDRAPVVAKMTGALGKLVGAAASQ